MSAHQIVSSSLEIDDLLPLLSAESSRIDGDDAFAAAGLRALAERGFPSALVPAELGGGSATHGDVCDALRRIAHASPSAALTLAMHQHLVAAAVWRWRRDGATAPFLTRVASEGLLLVSTGANDWLESSGTLVETEGGYRLNATKPFASGSPVGNLVVTSARLESGSAPEVLHFAVSLTAEGVTVRDDWKAMGMRGTGSNTIVFRDVLIPQAAVTLRRPAGEFHPVWGVILTVALPLIMSVYLGIAERAAAIARELARPDEASLSGLGNMYGSLVTTRLAVEKMIALCDDFRSIPTLESVNETIACKTIAAREAVQCVDRAMAAVGGRSYYRDNHLERLARDVRAAVFHPLQELRQARMSGRILLGLDPVS